MLDVEANRWFVHLSTFLYHETVNAHGSNTTVYCRERGKKDFLPGVKSKVRVHLVQSMAAVKNFPKRTPA